MKKTGTLFLSGIVTLGIGAGAIFGNGLLASQTMAAGINPSAFSAPAQAGEVNMLREANLTSFPQNESQYTLQATVTSQDKSYAILKVLETGETVMVQYGYDEDGAKATRTYTPADGEPQVENYAGDQAELLIKRYTQSTSLPPKYVYDEDYEITESYVYDEGQPDADDITQEAAVDTGKKELTQKYALQQEVLDRFSVTTEFYSTYEDLSGPVWWVNLYPINVDEFSEIGCYTAILNANTGEALRLLSAVDGKG